MILTALFNVSHPLWVMSTDQRIKDKDSRKFTLKKPELFIENGHLFLAGATKLPPGIFVDNQTIEAFFNFL